MVYIKYISAVLVMNSSKSPCASISFRTQQMSEILQQANETTSLNSIYMQANTRLLHIMKGISQVLKCGRFLLRHKMSSDKMLMSGSNP